MKNSCTHIALTLTVCTLLSCSDSSTESENPSEDGGLIEQGVFVDSAVEGLSFETATLSGLTDDQGAFRYRPDETIVFSIGELTLPQVDAKSIITPIDLGSGSVNSEATTINIARLLQSLDIDGIPENGITIPDSAAAIATAIDFDVPIDVFASHADVINLVANSGSVNGVVIEEEVAREHLLSSIAAHDSDESSDLSQITGYWIDNSTGDYINIADSGAITFYDAQAERSCHTVRQGTVSALETSLYLVETASGESQQLVITRTDNRLNILLVGTVVLVDNEDETDLVLCLD